MTIDYNDVKVGELIIANIDFPDHRIPLIDGRYQHTHVDKVLVMKICPESMGYFESEVNGVALSKQLKGMMVNVVGMVTVAYPDTGF